MDVMVSVFALSIEKFGAVFEVQFSFRGMVFGKGDHSVLELHRRKMSDETP